MVFLVCYFSSKGDEADLSPGDSLSGLLLQPCGLAQLCSLAESPGHSKAPICVLPSRLLTPAQAAFKTAVSTFGTQPPSWETGGLVSPGVN